MSSISCISWNIWQGKYLPEVIHFLQKQNADVIGLQEIVEYEENGKTINSAVEIATHLKYHVAYFPAVHNTRKEKKFYQGNAILSKHPISLARSIILSDLAQYENNAETEPRIAVTADILIDNTLFHIYSTHLAYSTEFTSTTIKRQQVDTLISQMTHESTIVLGDFNSHPDSPEIVQFSSILSHADSKPLLPTWTIYPFDHHGFVETKLAHRIDYIFVSSDIKVKSFKILDSKASDHLPIMAELEKQKN